MALTSQIWDKLNIKLNNDSNGLQSLKQNRIYESILNIKVNNENNGF